MLLEVRAHREIQTEKTGGDAVVAKGVVSLMTPSEAVRKFPLYIATCVRK